MRVWKSLTQRPERWQRKNEIADRATADHQNAVHAFTVATALRAASLLNSKATCVDLPQAGGYSEASF